MKASSILPSEERKYIEVKYDQETQHKLAAYCQKNGIDCTQTWSGRKVEPHEFGFHTTIWYSTSYHSFENRSFQIDPISVVPTKFELFGPNQDILVMLVEDAETSAQSQPLLDLRNSYGSLYKMQDAWPDYKPHITLSYNHSGDIPDIRLPNFEIRATVMNIKPIEE